MRAASKKRLGACVGLGSLCDAPAGRNLVAWFGGTDAIFCTMLAENAVHAAMSGRTNLVVGKWNRHFVYVPIPLATRERQRIDNMGSLWKAVLFTTRQDDYFYEGQGDD